MKKLKVIQFLPSLDAGGVERGTLEIASALMKSGHESLVVSAGGRLVAELEEQGSSHHLWRLDRKSPLTLRFVRPLRRWLEEQRADVIHVRSRMPAWTVWLAWRKMNPDTRPRLVSTLHGLHSVSRYSEIMGCGERVITVSETARQYLLDNYPRIDSDKIQVIYRGVDPSEFPRGCRPDDQWLGQWQKDFPQLEGKKIICLAGRLTRLKGHQQLIELVDSLHREGREVAALVVGGEDPKRIAYAQALYAEVRERGLSNHVVFTGHRSDLKNIYAVSDVVLSLSTKPESFGRSVLEALSIGTPVVGYAHGGVGEILESLYPAGKVEPSDASGLQTVVQQVLTGEIPAIAENTNYLLSDMCGQVLDVYQEVSTW